MAKTFTFYCAELNQVIEERKLLDGTRVVRSDIEHFELIRTRLEANTDPATGHRILDDTAREPTECLTLVMVALAGTTYKLANGRISWNNFDADVENLLAQNEARRDAQETRSVFVDRVTGRTQLGAPVGFINPSALAMAKVPSNSFLRATYAHGKAAATNRALGYNRRLATPAEQATPHRLPLLDTTLAQEFLAAWKAVVSTASVNTIERVRNNATVDPLESNRDYNRAIEKLGEKNEISHFFYSIVQNPQAFLDAWNEHKRTPAVSDKTKDTFLAAAKKVAATLGAPHRVERLTTTSMAR